MPGKIPTVKLSNGVDLPVIGLGTYARKAYPGQYQQAVEDGIDKGYRHIDTASCYNNEEEVGEGINNKIKQGVVGRGDLFVTTKLWNDKHAEKDVIPSLKESLSRLKLDYVDLYLIHWPFSVDENDEDMHIDYLETWRGMEKAQELGLTKAIGVSNFNKEQLIRLMKHATIKPVVNQFEVSPTLTRHDLVTFCIANAVQPIAYTPFGLLSDLRPGPEGTEIIKTDPKLGAICEKYGKTRPQVALRYLIQRGLVVIPKTFTASRMDENMDVFDFELNAAEMAVVDSFNINHHCVPVIARKNFDYYPFSELV